MFYGNGPNVPRKKIVDKENLQFTLVASNIVRN